jgi:hypothetical protein
MWVQAQESGQLLILGLSEDANVCTFTFVKYKIKPKQFMLTKTISKIVYIFWKMVQAMVDCRNPR